MHVDDMPRPRLKYLGSGASPAEIARTVEENYTSLFGAQLSMLDWPRDKRIEYQLGKLLFRLDGPRLHEKPGEHRKALDRCESQLLELCDLPGPAPQAQARTALSASAPHPAHDAAASGDTLPGEAEELRKELAEAHARIAELEGQLSRGLNTVTAQEVRARLEQRRIGRGADRSASTHPAPPASEARTREAHQQPRGPEPGSDPSPGMHP